MAVGRPREFSNAAEKQKAYRDRQRQEQSHNQEALILLAEVQAEKVTLLNYIRYLKTKNKVVEVYLQNRDYYAKVLAGGYSQSSPSVYLIRHMIRLGELEPVRKDWGGQFYQVKDDACHK